MAATGYAPLRVHDEEENDGEAEAPESPSGVPADGEKSHSYKIERDEEMERSGDDEELLLPRPEVREELPSMSADVQITVDPPSDVSAQEVKSDTGKGQQISLPWKILVIVYGVLVGDAIASTVITPFVPGTLFIIYLPTLLFLFVE
jgi:hypothetical protein